MEIITRPIVELLEVGHQGVAVGPGRAEDIHLDEKTAAVLDDRPLDRGWMRAMAGRRERPKGQFERSWITVHPDCTEMSTPAFARNASIA